MRAFFQRLAFSLANTAAVLVALFVAFARDLERPYWAMFTVFIIAKPISGAVRSKAVYRFFGSLAGAAMAVFLIPPLVQAPVLLSLTVSAWVGVCVFVSLFDRTPRSYLFLLAGYTATIVGFSVVDSPLSVFDTAVSRLEEITLGIICGSVAHSVFFPQSVLKELVDRVDRAIGECGKWISAALLRDEITADRNAERRLAGLVTDLHLVYSHVAFETSNVTRADRLVCTLQERFAVLLPHVSNVQAAAQRLRASGLMRVEISELLECASRWSGLLASQNEADRAAADIDLQDRMAKLMSLPMSPPSEPPRWRDLLEQTLVRSLAQCVQALKDCQTLAQKLKDPDEVLPSRLQSDVASTERESLHHDAGIALLSGCAAAGATLIACVLWIEGSWPEGAVAAQFAAIGCSLFATLDNPARVVGSAVAALILALPFGALYEFAIFPRIDGFPSLALVLFPVLMLFSFMQTFEKLEGAALVLSIAFSGALALQPSYRADFPTFVNSNGAEIVGLLIAVATNLVFRTIDPAWNALRISRAGWRAVSRLARARRVHIRSWTLQMFDRLGLVTSRLAQPAAGAAGVPGVESVDGLRDLRIGLNIATIKSCQADFGGSLGGGVAQVMSAIAADYDARSQGLRPTPPAQQLELDVTRSIDSSIHIVAGEGPSEKQARTLSALTALRLDFDALAPAYTPPVISQ